MREEQARVANQQREANEQKVRENAESAYVKCEQFDKDRVGCISARSQTGCTYNEDYQTCRPIRGAGAARTEGSSSLSAFAIRDLNVQLALNDIMGPALQLDWSATRQSDPS